MIRNRGPSTDSPVTTQALGRRGESLALAFLKKNKYAIVETHFRHHRGEIDIVARLGPTLVFVEVKTRTSQEFGRPEESVTPLKQLQIRKVAEGYLLKHRLGDAACRFDVIAVRMRGPGEYTIDHFKNAF